VDRINVIRKSVSAFVCGVFGLLPVIGFPFAVAAVVQFILVRRRKTTDWNPAERYLDWAGVFALIGFVLTLIVVALVLLAVINQTTQSGWQD